jgi:hypothetical protein
MSHQHPFRRTIKLFFFWCKRLNQMQDLMHAKHLLSHWATSQLHTVCNKWNSRK